MIIPFAMLAIAFAVAFFSLPRPELAGGSTHKFQGAPGGLCTVHGCGKPYASPVHHDQR